MKSTHTFVELKVSKTTWEEIAYLLRRAGYDQAFVGDVIDMNGIGLTTEPLYIRILNEVRYELKGLDIPQEIFIGLNIKIANYVLKAIEENQNVKTETETD